MRTTASRFMTRLTGAAALLTVVVAPAVTATALAPPAAAATAGGAWTADGHDAARSFANPDEKTITPATVGRLRQQYVVAPKKGHGCADVEPPVVADGRLYATDTGGDSGALAAYATGTGKQLWRTSFAPFVVPPRDVRIAYAGGRVFVADDECDSYSDPNGDVAAYDAASGKLLWHVSSGSQGYERLTVARGLVVASGSSAPDGYVGTYAYDAATGELVWKRADVYDRTGTLASGLLLLSPRDTARTVAVDVATGATRWTLPGRVSAVAGLPGSGTFLGRIAAADGSARLASLSLADGSTRWTAPDGLVATDGTTAYVTQADGTVAARAVSDGHQVWTRSFAGADLGTNPVLAGGVVYVTRHDPATSATSVVALRATTGGALGTVSTVFSYGRHPVVAGGRVYVADGASVHTYHLS